MFQFNSIQFNNNKWGKSQWFKNLVLFIVLYFCVVTVSSVTVKVSQLCYRTTRIYLIKFNKYSNIYAPNRYGKDILVNRDF